MRLEKHIHGFVVFVIIFTGIICVYEYSRWPSPSKEARAESVTYEEPAASYDVRLVSLDFISGKTYTTLVLKLRPGQPAPEKLIVNTRFYVPGGAENQSWSSPVGITRPSATGDRVEVTVTSTCYWCDRPDTPRAGYFANVYVTALYEGKTFPLEPGPLVGAEIPVMVQAERKPER